MVPLSGHMVHERMVPLLGHMVLPRLLQQGHMVHERRVRDHNSHSLDNKSTSWFNSKTSSRG